MRFGQLVFRVNGIWTNGIRAIVYSASWGSGKQESGNWESGNRKSDNWKSGNW